MLKGLFRKSRKETKIPDKKNEYVIEVDTDIYSETEEELKEDFENEDNFYSKYLSEVQPILILEHQKFYQVSARRFIPDMKNCWAQRQLNLDHIEKLEKSLLEENYLAGVLIVAINKKTNIVELVDGQHRCMAYWNVLKKNLKKDFDLLVLTIETDDTRKLHQKVNNHLPYILDLETKKSHDILESLQKSDYGSMIVSLPVDKKSIQRPRIDSKKMLSAIQEYIRLFPSEEVHEVVAFINEVNQNLGVSEEKQFFSKNQITEKMFQKAVETGFYLGLPKKLSFISQKKVVSL